jgi:hypothetical protein
VTYDRAYLIPDQTFAIPIKSSIVERNSEFTENWDTYKSVTSRSVNSGFDFFGKIGGKFSDEFLSVKSRMYNEKAVSMGVELRHRFHSIKQLPDSKLHPSFKNRILDILSLLKSNDSLSADYATQLLVRDYGTHYLTSVDAGKGGPHYVHQTHTGLVKEEKIILRLKDMTDTSAHEPCLHESSNPC